MPLPLPFHDDKSHNDVISTKNVSWSCTLYFCLVSQQSSRSVYIISGASVLMIWRKEMSLAVDFMVL